MSRAALKHCRAECQCAPDAALLVEDVEHRLHSGESKIGLEARVYFLHIAGALTPEHLHHLEFQRCERFRTFFGASHPECRLLAYRALVNYKNS